MRIEDHPDVNRKCLICTDLKEFEGLASLSRSKAKTRMTSTSPSSSEYQEIKYFRTTVGESTVEVRFYGGVTKHIDHVSRVEARPGGTKS
ncbi:hypothetical protein LIS04_160 [Listeria phage LIS04]|nr:hypothetical protein LIS04_160 [Listeria phage LIS04]